MPARRKNQLLIIDATVFTFEQSNMSTRTSKLLLNCKKYSVDCDTLRKLKVA